MPEANMPSSSSQLIQPVQACGHDKKHKKKRHHKRKRDESHEENELIQSVEICGNDKKHKKKKKHKRKRDDSHQENELIQEESQSKDMASDNKKNAKKKHHKRKTGDLDKENEFVEQDEQSKALASDNKKHTQKRHHERETNDPYKANELMEQEAGSKLVAADKKKHTKRKQDYSHKEKELIEQEKHSTQIKNRLKIQNSKATTVNELALSGNTNCDGDMGAAGSEAKGESHRKSSAASKDQTDKGKKTVRFSSDVQVSHSSKNSNRKSKTAADGRRPGNRFTEEEDQIIRDACLKCVKDYNLEEGVKMILNTKNCPQAKGCWKEIGAAIPWRSLKSVYVRAAYIFRENKEYHKWTPDEIELIMRHVNEHGRQFKALAEHFNVHRHHVKDAWRRNRHPEARTGAWSQDEYQQFFELVNEDLKMKAFGSKRKKSAVTRENISWWAISDKMTTRYDSMMCLKWYNQLTSPMVSKGLWSSCDDYRMLFNLSKLDACCFEDVDWDNLLENRDGDVCRQRWFEMTKHIGGNAQMSFMEQVDVLSSRYHIDMLEYRKISLSETDSSESEGSESDKEA